MEEAKSRLSWRRFVWEARWNKNVMNPHKAASPSRWHHHKTTHKRELVDRASMALVMWLLTMPRSIWTGRLLVKAWHVELTHLSVYCYNSHCSCWLGTIQYLIMAGDLFYQMEIKGGWGLRYLIFADWMFFVFLIWHLYKGCGWTPRSLDSFNGPHAKFDVQRLYGKY